jgi:hypothetical protein
VTHHCQSNNCAHSLCLLLKPPLHALQTHLYSRFTTLVLCMLLLLWTFPSTMTELLALVARKFLFCSLGSSFRGFTRTQLRRIQLVFVIVTCNECRSFSRCQFVSSNLNGTEILINQIRRLFVCSDGMPYIVKLS